MKRTWAAVLLASIALLVAGAVINTRELVILGAVGLSVALYSLVFTRRKIGLALTRDLLPDRVTVGSPAYARISFSNPAAWPSPGLVGRGHDGRSGREFLVPPLAPGASGERSIPLRTEHRGIHRLDPVELLRTDPLRLAGASRRYGEPDTLFVHPRVHPLSPLPAASIREADGLRSDRSPQGSESFHALREYVQGDDYRLIHWKSSARAGELVVKQFVDLWAAELFVVLDTRDGCFRPDDFESAVEIVASVAVAAARSRHKVSLMLGDGHLTSCRPGSGDHHELLDLLAGATCGGGQDLASIARRVVGRRTHQALVLVTGRPEAAEVLSFLAATRPFQRRLVVQVDSALQASPFVEMSRHGDEAISARNVADFVSGWNRFVS